MGAACCWCAPGLCLLTNVELVTNQSEGLNVSPRAHLKGKAWYVTVTPALGRQRLGILRSHYSLAESGKLSSEQDCLSRDRDQLSTGPGLHLRLHTCEHAHKSGYGMQHPQGDWESAG